MNKPVILNKDTVFSKFSPRDENSHKGTFGRALLICGSYGMAGACSISALSCINSGIGICDIICPNSIYPIVAANVKEAVFHPVNPENIDIKTVASCIKKAACIVIGCGMGQSSYTLQMLKIVIKFAVCPIVFDADGLNVLSQNISLLYKCKGQIIITPHPAEMARLTKAPVEKILESPQKSAVDFAKEYNAFVVLKLHETVVAAPNGVVYINSSGNAGMATGGSGDMLCGIISALVCSLKSIEDAVASAVFIHGYAGDLSAGIYSQITTNPSFMIDLLPCVYTEIEQNFK